MGYRALTLSGRPSQAVRLYSVFVTPCRCCRTAVGSYYPAHTRPAGCMCRSVWAFPGSFATTTGMISFPRGTLDVSVPPVASMRLCVHRTVPGDETRWVAPFGNPRLRLLAADRGLSQRCHVLHRLSTPRHPPCAHISLMRLRRGLRPVARRYGHR